MLFLKYEPRVVGVAASIVSISPSLLVSKCSTRIAFAALSFMVIMGAAAVAVMTIFPVTEAIDILPLEYAVLVMSTPPIVIDTVEIVYPDAAVRVPEYGLFSAMVVAALLLVTFDKLLVIEYIWTTVAEAVITISPVTDGIDIFPLE